MLLILCLTLKPDTKLPHSRIVITLTIYMYVISTPLLIINTQVTLVAQLNSTQCYHPKTIPTNNRSILAQNKPTDLAHKDPGGSWAKA